MYCSRWRLGALFVALVALPALFYARAHGSDHADTPAIAALPGADLTDVYVFPSLADSSKVVLIMNVHPLIPSGQGGTVAFDPNVLYQFKIDKTGDFVEDTVIQAKFSGSSPATQTVQIAGPVAPSRKGTVTQFETPDSVTGTLNTPFTLSNGVKVFCGPREDPFFFDLNQFFTIFPDRANPLGATFVNTDGATVSTTPANPNAPQKVSFRTPGQDYLAGFNVLSIVVEALKALFTAGGDGKIRVWCTTSK